MTNKNEIVTAWNVVQEEVRREFCRRFNLTDKELLEILCADIQLEGHRLEAGQPHVRAIDDNNNGEPS